MICRSAPFAVILKLSDHTPHFKVTLFDVDRVSNGTRYTQCVTVSQNKRFIQRLI